MVEHRNDDQQETDIPDQRLFEPDPELEYASPSWWQQAWPYIRSVIAALVVVSLMYISGVYHALLLTPTPSKVEQEPVPPPASYDERVISVHIHLLRSPEESGTERSIHNARDLIADASDIWHQAGIRLRINNVTTHQLSYKEQRTFIRAPRALARSLDAYNSARINVLLRGTLRGVNGVALSGTGDVAVADVTSHYDFRTLAHEVGHVLGLQHVSDPRRLMAQGSYGVMLTEEEIRTARRRAKTLSRE